MGTRCYIAKQVGANDYRTIYCQLDGYPSYLGMLLIDHYNTVEMVDKLLDLGDIYALKPKLEPDANQPHDFMNRQKDVTLAFSRDFDEEGFDASIKTLEELEENWEIEFVYIFTQDNKWKYFSVGELEDGVRDLEETVNHIKANPGEDDEGFGEELDEEIGGITY